MATQTGGLIRDQNLNVHFDVAPLGGKSNVSKAQKNGGLGGRKALNDISNSGWSSTLQKSKKPNFKDGIPVGEDMGSSKPIFSFGGKGKVAKAADKVQAGGRKALSDLTNSGKQQVQKASKKIQASKKLIAVAENQILPDNVVEEQFLHNHQECIKAREKAIDLDCFLKTIGLDYSIQSASPAVSPLSRKSKHQSSQVYAEVEEMPELLHEEPFQEKMTELSPEQTPCGSPKSPNLWSDHRFTSFTLIGSPKLPKH
ncbi:hypothetical protein NMG60_11018091 [Bertholletia excelsa]